VKSREIAERFALDGAVAVGSSPAEFASFLANETRKWNKVITEAGIKLE
jgi:tripartite-type tricarboxylate transporter receptor subunit TctC